MESDRVLRLLLSACLLSALHAVGENGNHLVIAPQSPVLRIGTNFTATCVITNTAEITADDLYWKLSETTVSTDQYTKINSSALNVTIPITSERNEWLLCHSREVSPYVVLNKGKFIHGIFLTKGYLPGKPENLSCVAVQNQKVISTNISCRWDPVGRQVNSVPTSYTLTVAVHPSHPSSPNQGGNVTTTQTSAQVALEIYPCHMILEIWVEAHNALGRIESEHLKEDADWFVKTDPPSDIRVISEESFANTLLIKWHHPIDETYMTLVYEIRYCSNGSDSWTYVSHVDMAKSVLSYRLQDLQPDTVYIIQLHCKTIRGGGYWSDWSTNTTNRTPEARPASKPDLWRVISDGDSINERRVEVICKDPVLANGRIRRFDMKIEKLGNESVQWESVLVNRSESDGGPRQRKVTVLKQINLADDKSVEVHVAARNSVGRSDEARLVVPEKASEPAPVKNLKVWPQEGQLWVEWKPPSSKHVSEYVVEWVSGDKIDWKRENRSTRRTVIEANLEKFVRYNVSVYPMYSGKTGKAASAEAYVEEGAPLEGPGVRLNGKPGCNKVELVWKEIPLHKRRGFITHYTVFYTSGTTVHNATVSANTTSYTLKSLSRNTKYDAWVVVSTARGSAKGSNHSFTTLKYDIVVIEAIVVGVSLGFLFIVLMIMLLCIYKKDAIKENFWPRIPNPGESTIGNWSPDYPLKAETPKENCLSGISVLDVDVCNGKCVFEEDKASLPLKKDKYLSEEHSSGIGGSSCMSSPRQSVSDSDEGGDMADTTASTIQYSSVVASNGYKGQTPSSQAQQAVFSRSESTQPLLDSEENSDMMLQEGSRQSQRFTHTARHHDSSDPADFNQLEMEQREVLGPLDFCPLEEDSEQMTPTDGQSADWLPAASVSSYMPQLGGYRPQ